MASMKLGSKSESFRREGHTWVCSSGLANDVTVEIGEMSFKLHKFPLISRSGYLEKKIGEAMEDEDEGCVVKLDELPGGSKAFELVSKFCYGIKVELTALNVVSLRCAGEYLEMREEYGEDNLISQTESFLNKVFGCWTDTMKALVSCEEVILQAEEAHVVSRCINSLAVKACADPTLFNWPLASTNINNNNNGESMLSPRDAGLWNGMPRSAKSRPITEDWWYEDVSFLSLPLYKRLIKAVEARGMKPDRIAGSLMFFANRYLPSMNRQCSMKESTGPATPTPPESDQRNLLEEIVAMLPTQKWVTQTKFLLRLLRSAMVLHASPSCTENLEKRVGAQLDQASLLDLLVPNMEYDTEMKYDIDCVQRIVEYFMADKIGVSEASTPQMVVEEDEVAVDGSRSLDALTIVAELVDSYLAEVASDADLKLPKFQGLATVIPDYARPNYDGIYHAIDVYLKAHPCMTESEREQICRIMNCQKLSVEASTHAASNERLPLRLVVQVLFFEQLKLRTQISNWLFMSENLDNSQNGRLNQDDPSNDQVLVVVEDVKDRIMDLEKDCVQMKQDIQKLAKNKKRWNLFSRMFMSKKKPVNPDPNSVFKKAIQTAIVKQQEHANGKLPNLNTQ